MGKALFGFFLILVRVGGQSVNLKIPFYLLFELFQIVNDDVYVTHPLIKTHSCVFSVNAHSTTKVTLTSDYP